MSDALFTIDLDLQRDAIQGLTDSGAVVAFFQRLGYPNVDPIPQTAENLGLTAESTIRPIRNIILISSEPGEFQVYLFEVDRVTVNHRKNLARAFGDRAGKFFLVVTTPDYERIDFVLVDTPQGEFEGGDSPFESVRPKVLPRVYSVDRRNPEEPLAVRVLRRFTWTETDGYAQHDKLRAALDLAHWSEPEFNNRALFSDHYLKKRLPDHAVAVWEEDPKPTYQKLSGLFREARNNLAQAGREELRRELLDPALQVLGFRIGTDRRLDAEHFAGRPLYSPDGPKTDPPIGLCLDLPWGRSLDAKDPVRDPQMAELNPGIRVVKLLEDEEGGAPWIIVTNGQIWRLYGRQAHSRATNYYEIDAEEVVSAQGFAAADPGEPFRYFWLFFRRQAFELQTFERQGRRIEESLLTHVWVESGEYAKSLGDRLKGRIFDQVFEILARGFLASRTAEEPPTQEELDEAFEGTLTFLYRILFLLYAEARDLLPVRDVRGYYEVSLSRLRKEIGDAAGPALSQADAKLAAAYASTGSSSFYKSLLKLFAIVDRGDSTINVPKYNGGLFMTEPEPDDDRAEARAARFLESHHLANLPLARVLDRLARDEDDKSHELVPIDYKSLGVRQLGSIYEGLLEFRLRAAPKPMAVVQGKGKQKNVDLVVLLDEARAKGMKIRRTGRSQDAPEWIFETGEIYLENDKQERHATGSYYTPDFVVEYIVKKTLAPILREKLEALRPRLRDAEAWRSKRRKQAADPRSKEGTQKYDFGPAVEEHWRTLIDDAFDFKVLDPAMGSGHFLVEAVDFITDEILRFLSGFPWNPVFAHLQYLRQTILAEMESQGITIDPERLTDTHLLKRHVLKRCIFGVDVNPMAVELAKVSLWLDCFTLGAPLSFLEHHLRRGNSLLGVDLKEAERVIEHQLTLLGSRFAGLKLATLSMIQVSGMPDVTATQLDASRHTFDEGSQALAPYLRLLHFFLAHVIRVTAKKKDVETTSILLELIRSREMEELFSNHSVEAGLARLNKKDRNLAKEVLKEAQQRGFFHWQLEFPEVFFTVLGADGRRIELDPNGGFDAVVGNPPWIRQESLKDLKPLLKEVFRETYDAIADIYVYVLTRGLQVLRPGGRLGMILQNKWFKARYGEAMRTYLAAEVTPLEVIDFGHAPLFDADTFPCILLLEKRPAPQDGGEIDFLDVEDLPRQAFPGLNLDEYGTERRGPVPLRRLRPEGWELMASEEAKVMDKVREHSVPLREFLSSTFYRGVVTGRNDVFFIDQKTRDQLVNEHPSSTEVIKKLLRGSDVQRWHTAWGGEWIIFTRHGIDIDNYPAVKRYLAQFRDRLKPKPTDWKPRTRETWSGRKAGAYAWYELQDAAAYYKKFEQPKIIYQEILFHSWFSWEPNGYYLNNKCFFIPGDNKELLAILNSSVIWWYLSRQMSSMKDDAIAMQGDRVKNLPIPIIRKDTQRQQLIEISEQLYEYYTRWNSLPLSDRDQLRDPSLRSLKLTTLRAELELHDLVMKAYGLSDADAAVLRNAVIPRDPLKLAEHQLAKLKR